ncbi:MAG TPA: class I SAM-dependent methyltransferase [Thermoanaerobaculia bacterium]|nr:class I SAM-dependent methyltransferase [Thermoanaerobaculia bacterium]
MAPERDLTDELAREIRAAVAQASPAASSTRAAAAPEEKTFRHALDRASRHITPAIPEAARLARSKNLALRALRFLWRDQTSFNALLVEAVSGLADRVTAVRDRLADDLELTRQRFAELLARTEELQRVLEEREGEARRRSAIQDSRLAMLESSGARRTPAGGAVEEPGAAAPALPPGVYSLFEERFRGSPAQIEGKQRFYLPLLRGLPGPVLDAGCGRGELLKLLAAESIPASGVEVNPISVETCQREGLSVEQGDAVANLAVRKDASLGAVVALQVVEHWTAETTFVFLREARRVISPGGVLIAETINSDSLSALRAFFLDPSHVRPVPPEALRFLAEAAGFVEARIELLAPMAPGDRLEEASENDAKLNRLLFGPQDYALIARVPRG